MFINSVVPDWFISGSGGAVSHGIGVIGCLENVGGVSGCLMVNLWHGSIIYVVSQFFFMFFSASCD